jgi:uncharacterized protein
VDVHLIIGLMLSAVIGLSLGLIGGGGSIITVPVLVYVIGVEAHEAVGMSLAVVGVTSLVGAALHHRQGTLRLKTGALFGASGIFGAFFGSRLTYLVSPSVLLLSFAGLMFVIAALMLARRRGGGMGGRKSDPASHHPNKIKAVVAGLVVGVLTGFLGVGGGFLVVPALVLFGGLSMKEAVGTSLFVIAINCAAGLLGHLQFGGFAPGLTLLVTVLAAAGVLLGASLSHRCAPDRLRKGFAIFTILVAVFLVVKNYSVLL